MEKCPCGNPNYDECCKPFHVGASFAPTAESLMRSRYSAYVKCELDYLLETLHPEERGDYDVASVKEWSKGAEWLGLEIVKTSGAPSDKRGQVEFIARFKQNGVEQSHHEASNFRKINDRWYYVDGKIIPPPGSAFQNDPCPCGSGKKYKRCCGKRK